MYVLSVSKYLLNEYILICRRVYIYTSKFHFIFNKINMHLYISIEYGFENCFGDFSIFQNFNGLTMFDLFLEIYFNLFLHKISYIKSEIL